MKRLWEIDFLRGASVILMVFFNYSFALAYLGIFNVDGGWLYWYLFPRLIGSSFILISGLSMTLTYNRNRKDSGKKFLSKGLKIFALGLIITGITFLTFPEAFIIFGILHLIGFSTIFGQFFLKLKKLNLLLGLMIIAFGFYLEHLRFDFSWLLWLGLTPYGFYTFDYFPVLPFFGFTLLGIYLGNRLYKKGTRNFKIKELSDEFFVKALTIIGRNSLMIYLLHQPLLVLLLMSAGFNIL